MRLVLVPTGSLWLNCSTRPELRTPLLLELLLSLDVTNASATCGLPPLEEELGLVTVCHSLVIVVKAALVC